LTEISYEANTDKWSNFENLEFILMKIVRFMLEFNMKNKIDLDNYLIERKKECINAWVRDEVDLLWSFRSTCMQTQ